MAKLSINNSIEVFIDRVYDVVGYLIDHFDGSSIKREDVCLINPLTQCADPLYYPIDPATDFFSCGGEHEYVEPELARLFRNTVMDECIRVKREGRLEDRVTFRNYLLGRFNYCFLKTLLKDSSQGKENQLLLKLS